MGCTSSSAKEVSPPPQGSIARSTQSQEMVSPQPSPVLKEAKDDQGVRLPNQVGSPHGGQAVEYKSEFPDNTLHLDHEEMVNIGVKVFEKVLRV